MVLEKNYEFSSKMFFIFLPTLRYFLVMAVMKQKNIRQAEKTLREMVDKADRYGEGKVELDEFIRILESSNVEVSLPFRPKDKLNINIFITPT